MKKIFPVLISLLIIACSTSEQEKITDVADYEKYLIAPSTNILRNLKEECKFWEDKIKEQPLGFTYFQKLGAANLHLFEKTGEVNYLIDAEKHFEAAQKLVYGKYKAQNLITQSSLAIKRHDFKKANRCAIQALSLAERKFASLMMQFDSEMELGNYELAKSILGRNQKMDSFDYLVRLSKFKDYEGDLDSAIVYMEGALALVSHENSSRSVWAKANLGDMYGHAGRVAESYQKYLEVLEQDPSYDYALKGIAWIAYSAERNPSEAKRIMMFLSQGTMLPDSYLLLAEISEMSNSDGKSAKEWINKFVVEAEKEKYEMMYNKYLINLYAEELERYEDAITLAKMEVDQRPTPASYDWLGWSYYQKGEYQKAVEIYAEHVEEKTFEPEPIYHMGIVYKNAGNEAKGVALLKECLEASYELGPQVSRKIEKELTTSLVSL